MLIKIDETVTNYIAIHYQSLDNQSPEIKALDNIARALNEGYHIITASLDVLEFLVKLDLLEHNSKRMYYSLLSKFTFLPAYEEFCTDYILVKSRDFSFCRTKVDDKTVFEMPIDSFSRFITVGPTVLLSEDLSDCSFYEKLAKKYITENRQKLNINICFEHMNGSGDGSYRAYEYKINRGHITLAVADSDKSYPEEKIGGTLLKLRHTYSNYKDNKPIRLFELDVREKENLIPPSFYLLCVNSSSKSAVDKLVELENSGFHTEKLRYLDIKDGIRAKTLKTNQKRMEYLKELFRDVSNLIACSYEEIENQPDEVLLMEGIGQGMSLFVGDILDNGLEKKLEKKKKVGVRKEIIEKLEESITKKSNLFEHLPDYLKQDWENLCRVIISWGCCEHPVA